MSIRALDQATWQIEALAQLGLLDSHFAVVDFMVESSEMQQPVQDENLQFRFQRVPQLLSVLERFLPR